MANSLAAKLGSSSTDLDARLKTLLTMKFVAAKGSTEFRRSLQAHKELVKDHTHFDALADELRGKDPHARIRTAAREALEAMFDSTPATLASLGAGGAPMSGVVPNASSRGKYGGISSSSPSLSADGSIGGGSVDGSSTAYPPAGSPQGPPVARQHSGSFPAPLPPTHGGPRRAPSAGGGGVPLVPSGRTGDDYVSMDHGDGGSGAGGEERGALYDEDAPLALKVLATLSDFITPPPPSHDGNAPQPPPQQQQQQQQQGVHSSSLSGFISGAVNPQAASSYSSREPSPHSQQQSYDGPRYPPAYPPAYSNGGTSSNSGGSRGYGSGSRSVDGFYHNPEADHYDGRASGSGGGIAAVASSVGSLFSSFASFVSTVPDTGPAAAAGGGGGHAPSGSRGSYGGISSSDGAGGGGQGYARSGSFSGAYSAPRPGQGQDAYPPQPLARSRSGVGFAQQYQQQQPQPQYQQQNAAQYPPQPQTQPQLQPSPQGLQQQQPQPQPDLLHIPQPDLLRLPQQPGPYGYQGPHMQQQQQFHVQAHYQQPGAMAAVTGQAPTLQQLQQQFAAGAMAMEPTSHPGSLIYMF